MLTSMQWYIPICSLFKGRLIGKPEALMPEETPKTFSGGIEHKVFLFDNLTLLIIKMKSPKVWEYCSQVFLELVCEIF